MTFSSPSWRSLNHLKGALNHPEKVTKNCQETAFKEVIVFVVVETFYGVFQPAVVGSKTICWRGILGICLLSCE